MKRFLLILSSTALLAGCRSTYDITLTNGNKIQNASKPVLDKARGQYRFKLEDGSQMNVSTTRIRLIEPHGDNSGPQFVSPTQKR